MTRPPRTHAASGVGLSSPAARVRAALAVLALAASVLLGIVLPSPPAQAAPDEDGGVVDVRLTALSPEVTRPGDTLSVVVEIENTGAGEITSPEVTLSVSRFPFATRNSLVAWEEADLGTGIGSELATVSLPGPLAPGAKAAVPLEAPADSMRLRSGVSGWGPRGLAVSVNGDTADSATDDPLGVLRTYVVWFPVDDAAVNPVQVSVLVPVVGPPVDPLAPEAAQEKLAVETAPGGRLAHLLASTKDIPGVTLAVDPELATPGLDPATDGSSSGAPGTEPSVKATDPATPDATDPTATWVESLLAQTAGNETYALPRFDQDWGAYADAGQPAPAQSPLPPTLSAWRTDLSWPAETDPDEATIDLSVRAGAPNVVVGSDASVPDADLTYTPTGRATASTAAGDATVLVPDATLSSLLTSPVQATPAGARQRVLAELAVISRERPGDQRHVLVTVPRDWSAAPAIAHAQVAAMGSAPWTSLEPVSTLAASPDPGVSRTSPPEPSASENELNPAAMESLRGISADVAEFATVVPDPLALTEPLDEAILATSSIGWRADSAGRAQAITNIRTEAAAITSSITVLGTSDFTLISTGSSIPVDIHSSLEQPATVVVALAPDDPRLVAEESVTVTVPAGSDASVTIPVKAIGSGDVTVSVQILAPNGAVVAQPYTFGVRVRADWETVGTVVVTSLLVLLLAGGVWRTIHRGRSDRRASAAVVEQLELSEQTGELSVLLDAQPDGPPPIVDPEHPRGPLHPDDSGRTL
ncbi:DUF6049 family protein [Sanguibacter sp. 25GB23B1]|uniref:DUF6049 family protein n=1 Tax=unclassified Sanguibacter TaxID=2645534 RepID=UPI0032AFBCBB